MGTKVYFKSYSESVGYSMRDLNEDATSPWPLYYEDRTLEGHFCNGFTSRSVNGYSEYDKELLKQTMLRHEEIFRKQVLELHRLYRIQRDLMVELKRKGEQISRVQVQSSQSSPFSSQIFSQDKKSLQEHAFPSLNTIYSTTVSGVDHAATHPSSLNGTGFQCGPMSRANGGSQGVNQLLDSRAKKIPRRMIDLQIPAEAYIENDETGHADVKDVIKPSFVSTNLNDRNNALALGNDMNPTLDTAQNACSEIIKSISHVRNGFHPPRLADLNEPLKEASCKEMDVFSSRSQHWTTTCEGLEGHQKSMRSGSSFLGFQKDIFHSRYKGEEAESVSTDGYAKGQKCPFYSKEIGQSSTHANSFTSTPSRKDVHPSLEHGTLRPTYAYDYLSSFSPKPSEIESWLREKPSQISDLSDISSYIVDAEDSGLNIHATSMPLSALPCTDYAKTASPLASLWGKSSNGISQSSIEIQAISCSSRSTSMNIHNRSFSTSLQNIGNARERWQNHHDFGSSTRSGHEKCTYVDGLRHGLLSESSASSRMSLSAIGYDKPTINNDANSLYEKSEYRGCRANLNIALPSGSILCDADGKESLSVGTSWLRTKSLSGEHININKGASQRKFHIIQGYSQMLSEYCTSTLEVDQKKEKEDNHADFLQDLSSNLKSMEAKSQQNETSVSSSCRRILGFPVPQCSNGNFTSSSPQEMSLSYDVKKPVNDELLQADPPCLSKVLNPDKHVRGEKVPEKCVAKGFNSFKDVIDLNSSATSMDHINSPTISSKDETELPSPVSVRGTATRFVLEIDLEAPVTSLSEEQIPSAESASNCNQLVSLVELESKVDGQQVTDMGAETLVRMAAETIQKISLDKPIHLEDTMCWSLPPVSAEVLHLFADVVISNSDDPDNILDTWRGDGDQESSDIDGMDYFEYMTLKLKEIKVDEYCCRTLERENAEEETDMAHLLMPRPRRGQARKRRQKRDFQKDILPGLASLSRYEVTEDLQMIGGLMRASGQLWQPSGTRRNGGRTKSHGQPRGTRRQRNNTTDIATTVAAVPETSVDPQPMQPTSTDVEIDVRSIVGWGRTTRRCRRQRCSPGNILVPPPSS
ncbi:hypothetical protein Taro_033121 [Colocasia esculenta]|uniref:Uncharacterized protein n=1 Tax=Colocasia esculenta TaxID=4460 RepID=A0A843VUF5_COLES|nr:hypothetical protein [Colocasia esculenta]